MCSSRVRRGRYPWMTTRSKQWYTKLRNCPKSWVKSFIDDLREVPVKRSVKRGPGQERIPGEDFSLAAEVTYVQRRAAHRVGRIVTIGPVLLFSTETGDGWLLDPA